MASASNLHGLVRGVLASRGTRRALLARGLLIGMAAPVVGTLLTACGGNPEAASTPSSQSGGGTTGGSASTPAAAASTSSATPAGGSAGAAGTPKKGGTLALPVSASPTSWDLMKSDWVTWTGVNYLYDRLIDTDDKEQFKPMLATSWEASQDGLTYTLKLRTGVKFHDGTPFNAAAAMFNMHRYIDKADSAFHADYVNVDHVETPDDSTVKIVMKKIDVNMLYNLADWGAIQVSPTVEQKLGANYSQQPTGTGPFKFKGFVPDSHIDYVRNDDYWQTPPLLDGLTVKVLPEPSVVIDNLQAKTIDLAGITPKDVDTVKKMGVVVEERTTPGASFVALNVAEEPTSELAVRQAIARAVDRDAMIKKVLYGYAIKARAGELPDTPYYFDDIPSIEYDPKAAAKILDDAGWKLGSDGIRERDGKKLVLNIITSNFQDWSLYTQILQEQIKAIGIDSKISSYEWGTYLDIYREGKNNWNLTYMSVGSIFGSTQVMIAGWYPSAYWQINQISKATDPTLKQLSQQLQSIYDELQTTIDLDKRKQLAHQVQKLYQDNQLTVWLWHSKTLTAIQPYVKGYDLIWAGRVVGLDGAWLNK